MKKSEFNSLIREALAEAKEEKEAKKSAKKDEKKPAAKKPAGKPAEKKPMKKGGKLVDMKARLTGLKQMREQLQNSQLSESSTSVVEGTSDYADLQKYAGELEKLKQSSDALNQKIGSEIEALEATIQSEVGKIKEMIGLTSADSGKSAVVGEKKEVEEPID